MTLQPNQTEAAVAAASGTRAALFVGGFMTFCLLCYIQALLPIFSRECGVSPTQSSLALSLTSGVMAFALLLAGALSDAVGRKKIMFHSLFLSSALTLAMAFAPNWTTLLAVRLFMGISLCGVQSVAMAYMSEELDRSAFTLALGLFIGGSALGGMFGRLFASVVADHLGWRAAVAMIGLTGLCAALYFRRALPPSRNFVPRGHSWNHFKTELSSILADKGLLALFVVGFVVMSGFVTIYNYISYRLLSAPLSLSQTTVGFVSVSMFLATLAPRSLAVSPTLIVEASSFGRSRFLCWQGSC
ncbi:MFS transporter [Marivita sp.]|uniref:MFS transporter n=1 Tax=Marivita sp. TaxID=2003365 RepID=UPI0026154AA8|nr:MFS transporter [Marivita sp.]